MSNIEDFLKDGKWACNSCGACCSFVKPLVKSGKFPARWLRPDGSCKHLNQKNMCDIYQSRPNICRIEKTLKPIYTDEQIAGMCKAMKDYQESK